MLSTLPVLLGAALFANAQTTTKAPAATPTLGASPLPLTQYTFTYPNLPEQVNPYPTMRGPQFGYNVCNSTTEGPTSDCQTMFVNDIDDFCLWGTPDSGSTIGDEEAKVVAYCTKSGYGTRIMPPGTLTAVQMLRAPGYIEIVGLLVQSNLGLQSTDSGGELDPHGADLMGNPLGGLVFSNNLPSSKSNATYTQVNNWNQFIGSNTFCIKACDPTVTSPDFCQNIFDTVGCNFNMPANYTPNLFLSCLSDNQQPADGSSIPIPSTSSCTTYTSSLLYSGTVSASATASGSAATGSSGAGGKGGAAPSVPGASGGAAKPTGSSAATVVIGKPGTGLFAIASTIAVATLAGVVIML